MIKMARINTYQEKKPQIDLFRLLLCAALAAVIMIIMFNIYNNNIAETIKELQEKKDHDNTIWFIQHVGASIPTYASIIIMCIVYSDKKKYVPVQTQKEKLYISIILAGVTFLMFLYVKIIDGDIVRGDGVDSLLEKTVTWFVAQILPLSVVISYHAVRMGTEKRELEEAVAGQ